MKYQIFPFRDIIQVQKEKRWVRKEREGFLRFTPFVMDQKEVQEMTRSELRKAADPVFSLLSLNTPG